MNQTVFVGFSGKIGSGKNYIAEQIFVPKLINHLKTQYNDTLIVPYYFSFGDHLKVECLCRNSYHDLSVENGYNGFFGEKTQEIRDMLQKYGTENGRGKYHEDVWIRAIDTWVKIQTARLQNADLNTIAIIIISDVRFQNELKYIKNNNGIIIRINAYDRTIKRVNLESKGNDEIKNKIQSHTSETSLDDYTFKYNIDNSFDRSLDEINKCVMDIIICHYKKNEKKI